MKAFLGSLGGQLSLVLGGMLIAYIALLHLNLAAERRSAAKWQRAAIEEQTAHKQTVANYRAAAEAARKADLENKQRVEAEYARIQSEKTNVQKELASARERLRLERLRSASGADPRSSGAEGVPATANTASGSSGADRAPVMDEADKLTCEVNTLVAESWISWWERVRAVER